MRFWLLWIFKSLLKVFTWHGLRVRNEHRLRLLLRFNLRLRTSMVLNILILIIPFLGNPACDMARIITMGVDAEIRRDLETFICDYYHENLTNFLKPHEKEPSFTVEQVAPTLLLQIKPF